MNRRRGRITAMWVVWMVSLVVALHWGWAAMSRAQEVTPVQESIEESPPAVGVDPVDQAPQLPSRDPGYERQKREALREHPRFEFDDLPPGHTAETWAREMAATGAYDRGYDEGYREGWRAAMEAVDQGRDATVYDEAMAQGSMRFHEKDYGAAARQFVLAAKLDQGDPISRMFAARSLLALQHYEEALLLARRAWQLQPNLVYLSVDVRKEFSEPADFDRVMKELAEAAEADAENATAWSLLGYFRFFSGDHAGAFEALKRARALRPEDHFVESLLETARLSVPAAVSKDEKRGG